MTTAVLEPPPAAAPPSPTEPVARETLRDAMGLKILRAILHVVDHRKSPGPVLSDAEIVLTADERLQTYLAEQIANVLADPETADAKFDAGSAMARSCYAILAHEKSFLAESRRMAEALWAATGTDKRISAGSLIVCLFRAENHPVPLLALLKVDPSDVLVQTVSREKGRVVVSLRVAENALPTARERLQKAALVAPKGYAERYDLLLVDRMVAKAAADFFAVRFLAVQAIPTPAERTKRFYLGYFEAKKELSQPGRPPELSLTDEQADDLKAQFQHALAGDSLDVAAWLRRLKLPAKAKAVLAAKINEKLDVQQFEIDPTFAETKLAKTQRYRGGFGILIEFSGSLADVGFKKGSPWQNAAGETVTPVTLQVPNLRLVQ